MGAFSFVLHSHLPYARLAGRWPHGEEWLHEAAAETYIPLLNALNRLRAEGVSIRLTLTLSPILLEQLADEVIQTNFRAYMHERIAAIEKDLLRFEMSQERESAKLAQHYLDWYVMVLDTFNDDYDGDLISAFRQLQQAGVIEIATCAATHGFLPLLKTDHSIELQLKTAVESYKRHFGAAPKAIWLPECAYRPAIADPDGRERVGIESFLSKYDLQLFFVESHLVEQARAIEPDDKGGESRRTSMRGVIRWIQSRLRRKPFHSTYMLYNVARSAVAVLARNRRVSLQVWSADWGYPGDFSYREFHKKDEHSGMRYWRVTGSGVDLGIKERYDMELAAQKVEEHAEHFSHLVLEDLQEHGKPNSKSFIAANFDTELFGHWWHEGIDWLEAVLRKFALSEEIQLVQASQLVQDYPPQISLQLPPGSWGANGDFSVWQNEKTAWMWKVIHDAEQRMVEVVAENPIAKGNMRQALDQAVRELLLLQSSDWPFLVTTGQADRYAVRRFLRHVERFHLLLNMIQSGTPDPTLVKDLWEQDKIFPELDYRWFQA